MAVKKRTKHDKKPAKKAAKATKPKALAAKAPARSVPAKGPVAKTPPGKPGPRSASGPAAGGGALPAPPAKAGEKRPAGDKKPGEKKPGDKKPSAKKGRQRMLQRRGPDGELLAPGELLLPGGPTSLEEVQYFFRGCVAAEHVAGEVGVSEVLTKRGIPETEQTRAELGKIVDTLLKRFERGSIEPSLPVRPAARRNFPGVVERAKQRRREIGAFLRGLDLGRTETSHMDAHGEASLQGVMEWAARLENLVEADEPEQADYNQFHRGLDQLDNTTEALIIDVELTLRRLRDRLRAK
jgi:hypothetical protein